MTKKILADREEGIRRKKLGHDGIHDQQVLVRLQLVLLSEVFGEITLAACRELRLSSWVLPRLGQ